MALVVAITPVSPSFRHSHKTADRGQFGGLDENRQRLGRPPWLPKATILMAIAVGVVAMVSLLTGRHLMPRGNLVVLAVAASLLMSCNRWIAGRIRSRRFGCPRILLMGEPEDVALAHQHLRESELGASIVGECSDPGETARCGHMPCLYVACDSSGCLTFRTLWCWFA